MTDVGSPYPADPRSHPAAAELVVHADLVTNLIAGPGGDVRGRWLTVATVPEIRLVELERLLQPLRWADLSGRRITMARPDGSTDDLVDGTTTTYQETFTADSIRLWPVIECHRRTLARDDTSARARALEYRLSASPPPGTVPPERWGVLVDQGSIVLHDTGTGVRISTTKRVRFPPPFDGPGLTLFAGTLGYAEAFEAMVTAALADVAEKRRLPADAGTRGDP